MDCRGYNLAPRNSSTKDDTPRSASRILNSWSVQNAFRASGRTTSEDTGERKTKKRKLKPAGERRSAEQHGDPTTKKENKTRHDAQNGLSGPIKSEGNGKGKGKAKDGLHAERSWGQAGSGGAAPRIMPHETLGEYNRRVEDLLRPGLTKAMKESKMRSAQERLKKGKGKEQASGVTELAGRLAGKGGDESDEDVGIDEDASRNKKRKRAFDELPTRKRLNDVAQAPPTLLHQRRAPAKAGSVWSAKGQGKSGLSAGQERILAEERERVVKRYREMKAEKEAKRVAPAVQDES